MYKKLILLAFLLFGLGWLSHLLYSVFSSQELQSPLAMLEDSIFPGRERSSPHDWVKEEQIHINSDSVSIDIKNPQWAVFTDTNSMDPLLDETSHAIEIVPEKKEDIHIGDIVSYKSAKLDGIVIHRIVDIGDDGDWYALAKGDNNTAVDPEKVRFGQIERVLVAIIY